MEESQNCANPQKNENQILTNSRLVALLPVCNKIFERLHIIRCLTLSGINILLPNQSRLFIGVSCINQLLSILTASFPLLTKE